MYFFLLNCIKFCNDLHKLLATQKRREAREEIIEPYQAIMQALPIRECKTRTDASSLSLSQSQSASKQSRAAVKSIQVQRFQTFVFGCEFCIIFDSPFAVTQKWLCLRVKLNESHYYSRLSCFLYHSMAK